MSDAEIANVMGDIQNLQIRGEYASGGDTAQLSEVAFAAPSGDSIPFEPADTGTTNGQDFDQMVVYSTIGENDLINRIYALSDGDDPFLFEYGAGLNPPDYYDAFAQGFTFLQASERYVYDDNGLRNILTGAPSASEATEAKDGFVYGDGYVFGHEFSSGQGVYYYTDGNARQISFSDVGSQAFSSFEPFFESGSPLSDGFAFAGPSFDQGPDIVISDGTDAPAQTFDATPISILDDHGARDFVSLDGTVYYIAENHTDSFPTFSKLYTVDPVTGPAAVTDGSDIDIINDIEVSGDALFISGYSDASSPSLDERGLFLFREGAVSEVIDTSLGLDAGMRARPAELIGFQDGVLFRANFLPDPVDFNASQPDLFFSDGTAAGTVQLASADAISGVRQIVAGDNVAFVLSTDAELWRTDGTPDGTTQVIGDLGSPLFGISENHFVVLDDILYVVAPPMSGVDYRLLSIKMDGTVTVEAENVLSVGLSGDLFGPTTGTAGADVLNGDAGNNTIVGGGGNDTLTGGEGIDTAGYSGGQSSYTLQITPSGIVVVDRRENGDGTDTLNEFEFLDFANGSYFDQGDGSLTLFDLEQFADFATLTPDDFRAFVEIYIAYFDRAPDAVGLFFWGSVLAKGAQTLEQIADAFFTQPETSASYSDLSDNVAFASAVYQNVLGRDFDQAGLDFWVDLLENGVVSQGQFILEILDGVLAAPQATDSEETIAQRAVDAEYLQDKTDLGIYFSVVLGMSDVVDARDTMAIFDGSDPSVATARAAMDEDYSEALDPASGEFLMQLVGVFDDLGSV